METFITVQSLGRRLGQSPSSHLNLTLQLQHATHHLNSSIPPIPPRSRSVTFHVLSESLYPLPSLCWSLCLEVTPSYFYPSYLLSDLYYNQSDTTHLRQVRKSEYLQTMGPMMGHRNNNAKIPARL